MYDLIGDIHGHADELEKLLTLLDYKKSRDVYRHPSRKALFLGDFIDRGPKIRQVLDIVRHMVEAGTALAIMGNHELNALAFHLETPAGSGNYLRKRNNSNIRQHLQTLRQLDDRTLHDYLAWFRSLPLWLDLEGLRAVHACWDEKSISLVRKHLHEKQPLTDTFLQSACTKKGTLFEAVEILLKGKEALLPQGLSFQDKDGHVRTQIRTRWYLNPVGQTYQTYALQADEISCTEELDPAIVSQAAPYSPEDKPVFVGHYWLHGRHPALLAQNVACLDYSVAKNGFLCAYRWDGEKTLSHDHFEWVRVEC